MTPDDSPSDRSVVVVGAADVPVAGVGTVGTAETLGDAAEQVQAGGVDCLVLAGEALSVEAVERLGRDCPSLPVVVYGPDGERLAAALEAGASEAVRRTGDDDALLGAAVRRAVERAGAGERTRRVPSDGARFEALFEHVPDAVVEVEFEDGDAVVRAVNGGFEDVFGYDADRVLGAALDEFVVPPGHDGDATTLDERLLEEDACQRECVRQTGGGPRRFQRTAIPVSTERDRAFCIYTDVTEQRLREEYQRVLARVLRHNVRNEMNAIAAHADALASRGEGQMFESAETIREAALDVTKLEEKARVVEQELGDETSVEPVDVVPLVESAVETVAAAFPDATLAHDLPDRLRVWGGDRLERALENVIENGVEHDTEAPCVSVTAERTDGYVEVRVADSGPGIPERERLVITGEREPDQLTHGSGLGLWLAKWVVESCGGSLRFEDGEKGSVVVLRLRAAEVRSGS